MLSRIQAWILIRIALPEWKYSVLTQREQHDFREKPNRRNNCPKNHVQYPHVTRVSVIVNVLRRNNTDWYFRHRRMVESPRRRVGGLASDGNKQTFVQGDFFVVDFFVVAYAHWMRTMSICGKKGRAEL